jgi:integrase
VDPSAKRQAEKSSTANSFEAIAELGATDVLKVLRRIEGRGIHETARRTRQRCSQVFCYAVQTERAAHDVTADLRGALAPVVSEHHAAITEPARIGELLRAIDGYAGHFVTAYALKLAPLLFVRPGELHQPSCHSHQTHLAPLERPTCHILAGGKRPLQGGPSRTVTVSCSTAC